MINILCTRYNYGGVQKEGHPNSWMVYFMEDLGVPPLLRKPPFLPFQMREPLSFQTSRKYVTWSNSSSYVSPRWRDGSQHVLLLKTSWHRIEWLKTIKDEQWPAFWSKICPIAMVKSWSHRVIPLKSHRFVVCLSPWFYPISRLDLEDAKTSSTSATSSTEVRQVEGKMSINVPYWAILSHYNTVNMGINGKNGNISTSWE